METMKFVSWALIIAILIIVVLKMTNQGETVDTVSSKVVNKLGLVESNQSKDELPNQSKDELPNQSKDELAVQSIEELVKEVLRCDIKDIADKPVSALNAGSIHLQKLIKELEQEKRTISVSISNTRLRNEDTLKELDGLRESIRTAKSYLKDPNTVYPVQIKSFSYANAEQLMYASDNALSQYNSLKASKDYQEYVNTIARGEQLLAQINDKLENAYTVMKIINEKISLGQVKAIEKDTEQTIKTFDKTRAATDMVLPEKEESKLPGAYGSDKDRIIKKLDDFND